MFLEIPTTVQLKNSVELSWLVTDTSVAAMQGALSAEIISGNINAVRQSIAESPRSVVSVRKDDNDVSWCITTLHLCVDRV
jgi:hypothetical protein